MADSGRSRTMPFGKYRGRSLADLPSDYRCWLLDLGDLRGPLRRALEAEAAQRDRGRTSPPLTPHRLPDPCLCDALIVAGFRALAKRSHPDAGGDHATMVAVNHAAEWLRQQVRGLAA